MSDPKKPHLTSPLKHPLNPFSGYLEVESHWYSPDGITWKQSYKYSAGTCYWNFTDVYESVDAMGRPEFGGTLLGYVNEDPCHSVVFAWYPARKELYIDHSLDSEHGFSDIYNERFKVEIRPDARVELSYYENGLPEEKWTLIAGRQ